MDDHYDPGPWLSVLYQKLDYRWKPNLSSAFEPALHWPAYQLGALFLFTAPLYFHGAMGFLALLRQMAKCHFRRINNTFRWLGLGAAWTYGAVPHA